MIRLSGIEKQSIVDGRGIRYVIFTQGCTHNCPGCHNTQTHSLNGGQLVKIDDLIAEIKDTMTNDILTGVTLSGGDPVLQSKQLIELVKPLKETGLDIWMYTGYTFEKLMENKNGYARELLEYIDVLVDGKYEEEKRTLDKPFVGSSNQRIIDVNKSIRDGRVVLFEQ